MQNAEIYERIPYSVVVDIVGDIVRRSLNRVDRVAHGHTNLRMYQHIEIVAPIPKGHYLVRRNTKMPDYLIHPYRFAAVHGHDIGKSGIQRAALQPEM